MTTSKKSPKSRAASAEGRVALTLKVSRTLYNRLAKFAVSGESLKSHQEVMEAALTEYLDKHK